ncbi:MAG: hypothetical protein CL920_03845 [Deltaproteobacteria bacterium]|nr:hypothetical protein [Deltaproteobacteria bacterium]
MREKTLPVGLYESLMTNALREQVERYADEERQIEELDSSASAQVLSQWFQERLERALETLPKDQVADRIAITNQLFSTLTELIPKSGVDEKDHVDPSGRQLYAIHETQKLPLPIKTLMRPSIPLNNSDLLVNGRHDLSLGPELQRELASSDRVDLLCSFLKWSGVRLLLPSIKDFVQRKGRGAFRVLTTTYMGVTEQRALDELKTFGGDIQISYDTQHTRLHAKAWLFHRESGYSTAYVGSSNLSRQAMLDGLEWNVRLSNTDNHAILEKIRGTFEQYWNSHDFRSYDAKEFSDRLQLAKPQQIEGLKVSIDIHPFPHQEEMLEALRLERQQGHTKNLVVAATGTGKTIVAALDYRELRKQGYETLLFVAHRQEILRQSQQTFQLTLKEGTFGELLTANYKPNRWQHVFASVQSLHEDTLQQIASEHFDIVIVDEFHHAAAPTYERILQHFSPKFLLGLTATPERADGKSILEWFDERVAAELRLWKALDQGLLCPFQYFGIGGAPDLASQKWTRGRYDAKDVSQLYSTDHMFIKRILQEVSKKVADPLKMRALGFCVDVTHATLMAERFTHAGIPAKAVSAHTSMTDRNQILRELSSGQINCIFSVDLFNEGVDLPDVDTVLFLRPTESATIFLQQLGRGLRRSPNKDCLTVLDFIGNAHKKFRFDKRFRAILGGTRKEILSHIQRDFPKLPPGCSIQLDEVAQKDIIKNIKSALRLGYKGLIEDLRELRRNGDEPTLAQFLHKTESELEDIYSGQGKSWTALQRDAGVGHRVLSKDEQKMEKALVRMLHLDDFSRLRAYQDFLSTSTPIKANDKDTKQRMLFALLGHMDIELSSMQDVWDRLWLCKPLKEELLSLFDILEDKLRHPTIPLPSALAPLSFEIHGTYSLDEITAAVDLRSKKGTLRRIREGVLYIPSLRTDLLFVTLEKSDKDYSPTTRYQDYPLSNLRFHWESQSNCRPGSPTGQRYQSIKKNGNQHALMFVRQRKKDARGITMPYTLLGRCFYETHQGSRPMQIIWHLEHPMPPGLYQETKLAAG